MFKMEKIVSRADNFADWYTSVIHNAQLVVYGSIKGTMIIQPNGWSIWETIQKLTNERFSACGVRNVALPMLIPMEEFAKEKKHLEGFAPESYLVTKVGDKELDSPYVIRPTSEILFCKYFNYIVSSYKSLPLKMNQWCSVMRAEKTTRPFLRNSEFHWQELHAVFATHEECLNFVKEIINIYADITENELCMPVLKGEKTVGERFAGADNTFTIETLMQDGQMIQSGTSHNLGTTFSKIYDIKYQSKENKFELVQQMSAGISTRLIGAIIMCHSDDNGLVLPPVIAPTQIKINVMGTTKNPELLEYAKELKSQLNNYRVEIDDSDSGLGYKLSSGEVLGIPIQIVIGRETLSDKKVTLIRRDDLIKQNFTYDANLASQIEQQLKILKTNLYTKAKNRLDDSTVDVKSIEELKDVLAQNKIARCHWAGNEDDEKAVKEQTGATPRVIIGHAKGTCFFTKKPSTDVVIFGRAY